MAEPAERMKAMRARRKASGMREVRLFVPDARSQETRLRVARAVETLSPQEERDAMRWIESVSEFDETR